jgi:tRNA(Arg) A34 adenosine deaminase TadA
LALPAYKTEGLPWEMRGAFVDDKALAMATVPIGLQVVKGADDFVIYSGDNFLATTLDRVWHGEKSIDEAMDALCKKWQEYLAEG